MLDEKRHICMMIVTHTNDIVDIYMMIVTKIIILQMILNQNNNLNQNILINKKPRANCDFLNVNKNNKDKTIDIEISM